MSGGRWVLSFALLFGLVACDVDPAEPPTSTTTGMTGGDAGQDTGEPQACVPPEDDPWPCSSDADCAIAGDCCSCVAYAPASGAPGNCGGGCATDKCEEWGITQAVCEAGRCVAQGLSCNQALVTCGAEPPACEPGSLPRVVDGCFAGDCLPLEACDWAPGCDACADGQLCMHEQRSGCDYRRCVKVFAECQGEGPCCVGNSYCGNACVPTAEGFSCQ